MTMWGRSLVSGSTGSVVDKDCDIHIISGNGELLSWSRLERKTQKPQSQELEG